MIHIQSFIAEHITGRNQSFFLPDLQTHAETLHRQINGKSVLVIGGAGTIGASYIKALLRYEPAKLVVVDISENGLTELTRDLRSTHGLRVPDTYKPYPVNFGDPVFQGILEDHGPFEIVANFAAHKHVRSEKDHHSIKALLHNNVLKAEKLLNHLNTSTPQHFFCVSTDKAANPVNIMGASKKIMEEMIMAYASAFPITTARFANVAFSQGSLLDGFVKRMMKQQPLSAPSDVKRYFVSPEESGQICLLACILGESGDIFFPKLREEQMLTFSEIAERFLHAQGLEPYRCASEEEAKLLSVTGDLLPDQITDNRSQITDHRSQVTKYPVYFFESDTSGEKPFEEFYTAQEQVDMDTFQALGVIKNAPRKSVEEIRATLEKLENLLARPDLTKPQIVQVLAELVPGFEHVETGKSLDQRM